jgi:hypothetical protein
MKEVFIRLEKAPIHAKAFHCIPSAGFKEPASQPE